ncbi:MAG: hypothetical protein E7385_04310 [Ruminococcaceae bacterium]|nr:hypothetical protein [Oscillospiraceae bacterium]
MKKQYKILLTLVVAVLCGASVFGMCWGYFSTGSDDSQLSNSNNKTAAPVKPTATVKPTVQPTAKPTSQPTAQPTATPEVTEDRTTIPGEVVVFAGDGCYTWWTNALAFRYKGQKNQTYLSYVNEEGQMSLASFDHDKAEFNYSNLADFEKDDHNSAALTILPNGKILAVYARHSADKFIRWRISNEPEDITSFGEEQRITSGGTVTYIQLHKISDSEYRIFYRYSMSHWSTRIYNWVEDTWTDEIVWLTEPLGKQFYLWTQEDKQEGKINVFMTAHPVNGPDQNIRYGYFDEDGKIYTTGDKLLGDLNVAATNVLSPRDFDVVYEAKEGEHTRLYDVSYMGDRVGVLYGVGNDGYNSKYYYAYYDNAKGQWVNNYICDSGKAAVVGNMYFGGLSFDKKDMQTLYVARREGDLYRMEKWTTTDYGATWSAPVVIDESTSATKIIMRPIIPYNASEDIDVIYIKGRYPTYLTYDTDIVFYAD